MNVNTSISTVNISRENEVPLERNRLHIDEIMESYSVSTLTLARLLTYIYTILIINFNDYTLF